MSAAAAGASCRNARRRQAQQLIKDKAAAAKAAKEKADAERAALEAMPPKSKHFHQLPPNYLRAPIVPQGRKMSAGYTGPSSKLLLPISEQHGQRHSPSQLTLHEHARHPSHYTNEPRTPTICHKKLPKSMTASFPLALQGGSPPGSPGICFRQQQQFFRESQGNLLSAQHPIHIQIPASKDGGIIITPATPLPSPSPHQQPADDMPDFPLERACSVYRAKKLGVNEPTALSIDELDEEQQQQQFYLGAVPNGGGHHAHWADEFCDTDRTLGVCTCDHVEVKARTSSSKAFFFSFCPKVFLAAIHARHTTRCSLCLLCSSHA